MLNPADYEAIDCSCFTPCLRWLRGTRGGKPVVSRIGYAYRIAWEASHGITLDAGTILKRLCHEPLCVNWAHFRAQPRRLDAPRAPADPEDQRRWNLRKYGITPADYDAMLAAQGGVCAVCRRDDRDRLNRRLHVDHDHATGRVRGLLCARCNNAIGHAGEDPERLRALALYLEEASSL